MPSGRTSSELVGDVTEAGQRTEVRLCSRAALVARLTDLHPRDEAAVELRDLGASVLALEPVGQRYDTPALDVRHQPDAVDSCPDGPLNP